MRVVRSLHRAARAHYIMPWSVRAREKIMTRGIPWMDPFRGRGEALSLLASRTAMPALQAATELVGPAWRGREARPFL